MVPAEAIEAGVAGDVTIPSALVAHWRRAHQFGWSARMLYTRAVALDAKGEPKLAERLEPLTDPETGERLLTAKGTPRNSKVKIPGEYVTADRFTLQCATAWEGLHQQALIVYSDGKFSLALHRQPHLGRMSATEAKAFIESGGMPPDTQQGIPLTLWQELAIKAAKKAEKEDDEDD